MIDIDSIVKMLDWDNDISIQASGIAQAGEVKCLKAFFQPTSCLYGKRVWENCAIVICSRNDNELVPYLLDMLLWLQDINWPGAERVLRRLTQFCDGDYLGFLISRMIPALIAVDDYTWLTNLQELINDGNLSECISEGCRKSLECYFNQHE